MNWSYKLDDGLGLIGVYWNGIRTLTVGPNESGVRLMVNLLNSTGAVPQATMDGLLPDEWSDPRTDLLPDDPEPVNEPAGLADISDWQEPRTER